MEQTATKENIMGTMPEGKLLFKLALPMIFSVLVSSLYNIVDSIFVGRIGQSALTAISLGAPASSLMVELSFGIAVGVNAMLSRKLGEKDSDGVSKAAGQGFLLIGAVYLICLAFGLFGVRAFYAIQTNDAEIIPYCAEHDIGFVPFSPIASGLLSGKITPTTRFEKNDDVRNWVPQLSRRNIEGNQPIVAMLKDFAEAKNATPAQISLAWMLHKYPNVVPIPGSKNKERIIENLNASDVELSDDEFSALEQSLNSLRVYGHRGLGGF